MKEKNHIILHIINIQRLIPTAEAEKIKNRVFRKNFEPCIHLNLDFV